MSPGTQWKATVKNVKTGVKPPFYSTLLKNYIDYSDYISQISEIGVFFGCSNLEKTNVPEHFQK